MFCCANMFLGKNLATIFLWQNCRILNFRSIKQVTGKKSDQNFIGESWVADDNNIPAIKKSKIQLNLRLVFAAVDKVE